MQYLTGPAFPQKELNIKDLLLETTTWRVV